MEENTSLTMTNDETGMQGMLMARSMQFCSLTANTREEKAMLFKAMNNPDKRISDCINMEIRVKDLYCEIVNLKQDNGEVIPVPRTVFIDDTGVGYQAVSLGIYNAVKKAIAVYGIPTWEEPLPIVIKQIKKGVYNVLTFDVAG